MPNAQLGPYLYLSALMTAVVADDYLPFSSTVNHICAVAVFALECYIAYRIVAYMRNLEAKAAVKP